MKTEFIAEAKNQLERIERAIERLSIIRDKCKQFINERTYESDLDGTTRKVRDLLEKARKQKRNLQFDHAEILQDLWGKGIFL